MLWENDAQGHRNARNDREFQGKTPSRHRILGREYLGNISFSQHLSLYFCHTEKNTRNDFIQPTEINKSLQQIPHPSAPRKCLNSIPYLIPFFSGSGTDTGCLKASRFSPWAHQMGKGQGEAHPKGSWEQEPDSCVQDRAGQQVFTLDPRASPGASLKLVWTNVFQ